MFFNKVVDRVLRGGRRCMFGLSFSVGNQETYFEFFFEVKKYIKKYIYKLNKKIKKVLMFF